MKFIFPIVFLHLFIFSCTEKEKINPESNYDWDYVEIRTDNDTLLIYNRGENMIEFIEFDCEKYVENKIKEVKVPRAEIDSIYSISYRLITKPTFNKVFCTDYVDLYVGIQNHNSTDSIKLKSVCDWKEFNEETQKLNQILSEYIEE